MQNMHNIEIEGDRYDKFEARTKHTQKKKKIWITFR